MENIFDGFKANVFDIVANTMGYTGTWNGLTAPVLFNDPSTDEELSDHDYDYQRPTLEYKEGDWPGLKELINEKDTQTIEVMGKSYYTLKILGLDGKQSSARDGETYKVILQEAD